MGAPQESRFGLGLQRLFVIVAICASGLRCGLYLYRRPPYEVRQVHVGMTLAEGMDCLQPQKPRHSVGASQYDFRYEWGNLRLYFFTRQA